MPRALVAGCGFVGLATVRALQEAGWQVAGCVHSAESAERLRGILPVGAGDLSQRTSVENLRAELGVFDAVIHCASSGRGGAEQYRRVYLEGARHLAAVFAPARLCFTSSTSVYAQTDGEWVTEESAADPGRETGRLLRETEDFVRAQKGTVARLAGIYGPGRSVLLRKFFDGTAVLEGDGAKWINQAHRDDIARALVLLVSAGATGVFNIGDDRPLAQRELYAWLSGRFARPLPASGPIDRDRKRGWTNKRVSNAKLRALGWAPRFPSFFDAVQHDPALLAEFTAR